jgi:DNA polymerase III subunit alpha
MRHLEFDHWKFTRELWDSYQHSLSHLNHQTLIALQQQGLFISIPKEDKATLSAIRAGEIDSVLLESKRACWLMAQWQPDSLKELLIVVSFLRLPYFYSHYSTFQTLVERKAQQSDLSHWPEAIRTILKETHGFPLFMEQVAEIIVAITGLPLEECYSLLQRLKRKQVDLDRDLNAFLEAAQLNGQDREIAWQLFALIVEFSPDAAYRSALKNYVIPVYESAYLQTHYAETYQLTKERLKHVSA